MADDSPPPTGSPPTGSPPTGPPSTEPPSTGVPPVEDWRRLLAGRVAVVTGGGAGIGGAIARLFAQHGARVEIAEAHPERAARVGAEIRAAGGEATATVVDVTDDAQVTSFADGVLDRHRRVDVVVNNVGDYRPLVPFTRSDPDSWDAMYHVNLRHVFAVTRSFLDPMREQRSGSIVNVHSVEGLRGYPPDPVYGAMKAAVAHFTTCLAVSLGRYGIRVNGIGPDLTQTPQVDYLAGSDDEREEAADPRWSSWAPVGRVGWPEDQARVALFLASDLSAFVTGHNIPVDGGTRAGGGWFWSPTANRFVNRPEAL